MTDAPSMNDMTPAFPDESAPVAVIDDAPVAPPAGISTELHATQAAEQERQAAEDAALKAEADAKANKAKAEKPSLEEALKNAEAKLAEKEAKEAKPETKARGDDGKFAPKPAAAEQQHAEAQQPQPVKTEAHPPPQRFHDQAKAEWETTPESVRAEVTRTIRELEQGYEKYKTDAGEFNKIREFHDMATQSGVELRQVLSNYVQVEKLLQSDPDRGLKHLMETVGMKPMDAITAILRANNTTIYQLAEAVMKNPQAFNRQQQAPRQDPAAQQAVSEVRELRQMLEAHRLEADIIAPFRAANPRYDALQGDIANILKSGIIPSNLPMQDRLKAAYDEAETRARKYASMFGPTGAQTAAPPLAQTQTQAPAPNPAGQKSISGAPSPSQSVAPVKKKGPLPSIAESLARAAARR